MSPRKPPSRLVLPGTPLIDVEFVVLDLETTGGSPAVDSITEVGCVKVRAGEVLGELQCLVNPRRPIDPFVSALTGITDGMVADAEPIEAVVPSLLEFLAGSVLVAHNARFDTGFLRVALRELGYAPLTNPVVCTARLARTLLTTDDVPRVRLATLAEHLHARTQPCHRALADARATVDVLHALLERAATFGVLTLDDLVDFPKAHSRRHFRKIRLTDRLPHRPGVYLFRAADGRVLYVGKATDLRTRVRSYFSSDRRAKVVDLLAELATIDGVECANELEAGVREIRLIQRHRPRYNRRGRDPERYRYLRLTRERYPRLAVTRRPPNDATTWLGPFSSASQAEVVREAIEDAIPIRRCTRSIGPRTRFAPCVLLELGRCLGPCDGSVAVENYRGALAPLVEGLDGDPLPLLTPIRDRMAKLAAQGRYEDAARARDRLEALARAITNARRLRSLATAGDVVVSRRTADGVEFTALRSGRLENVRIVATATERGDAEPRQEALWDLATWDGAAWQDAASGPDDACEDAVPAGAPTPAHLADELALVARWLDDLPRTARLEQVSGILASPLHGGALRVGRRPGNDARAPGEARGRPFPRLATAPRRPAPNGPPAAGTIKRAEPPVREGPAP